MGTFDADTAVTSHGNGRYTAAIEPGWRAVGPNGGYIAAIVLRSLATEAGRAPRSLNVSYLAAPTEGPVEIESRVEKAGRNVTFMSGRMSQDGKDIVLAHAIFADPMESPEFCDLAPPELASAESLPAIEVPGIEIGKHFDLRQSIGMPQFSTGHRARVGGWIRLKEERPVDHLLLAQFADAWWPAAFGRIAEPVRVPTLELSVYFRCGYPAKAVRPGEHCMAVFESGVAAEGFLEEDGQLWSASGVLLAQVRQLALIKSFEES